MNSEVGLNSLVDIETRYRLDRSEIESQLGRDFPLLSRPALGSPSPTIRWVPSHNWESKRPGSGVNNPPPSSAEVKERVELYLYIPSESSWPVLW
jgi:hypothetical protein